MGDILKDALISPCGQYRYWLTRRWSLLQEPLLIVMLNPSTADAENDDPTIRRCMTFARREGFGGIRVMNLFAFRATSPEVMKAADAPIGTDNGRHLSGALARAADTNTPVLAAWGAHGSFRDRARMAAISAKGHGAKLVCLGVTKDGHPRHPLYVRADQPFIALEPRP